MTSVFIIIITTLSFLIGAITGYTVGKDNNNDNNDNMRPRY